MTAPTLRRVAFALAVAAEAAALLTLVGAVVLASDYRPATAEAWLQAEPVRSSSDWDRWHRWSAITSVLVAALAVVPLLALAARGAVRRAWLPLSAAVVGAGAALVGLLTRPLVRFDQLALWAVTVGDDVAGYWFAAFDDGVRFVIVGGVEVGQGSYARTLLVHLAAPAVAAAAASVCALSLLLGPRAPEGAADTGV